MAERVMPALPAWDAEADAPDGTAVAVSVIVPVSEQPDPPAEFYEEYAAALRETWRPFEFVFVVEPPFRHLLAPLAELARRGERVRVFEAGQSVGEAALLKAARAYCRGPIIVTLPPYRRVEASALPALVESVERGADVAVARRWPRRDAWINRVQNRMLHALIGRLLGGRIHDVACGVRAMRRDVLREIPLYGDFSRFLPLLALRMGYRVEEIPAPQHARDVRARFYRPSLYLRRLFDVLALFFVLRFTEKPLRFFGLLGSLCAIPGAVLLVVLLVQRLDGQSIANRPLLLLALLLLVLGVQAIALGLIGEIIVFLHAPRRSPYRALEHETPLSPSPGSE